MSPTPPTMPLKAATSRTALFDRFVAEQREALLRFLRRLTACEADAEDIAQESFLSLVRYRESESVEAWRPLLFRIALNTLSDRRRRSSARPDAGWVSLSEAQVSEVVSADAPHEQRIADQQELLLVRDTILRLPERCRQIYLLNRIEGMSYSEIARHCAISVKAVEKQITKALATLRGRIDSAAESAPEST